MCVKCLCRGRKRHPVLQSSAKYNYDSLWLQGLYFVCIAESCSTGGDREVYFKYFIQCISTYLYEEIFNAGHSLRNEALPGVLGNRGIRPFISGERGNKSLKLNRGTKAVLGNGEHRKSRFWFWGTRENADFFRGTREQVPPPRRASLKRSVTASLKC